MVDAHDIIDIEKEGEDVELEFVEPIQAGDLNHIDMIIFVLLMMDLIIPYPYLVFPRSQQRMTDSC